MQEEALPSSSSLNEMENLNKITKRIIFKVIFVLDSQSYLDLHQSEIPDKTATV